MGNLISIMIWCKARGSGFICGEKSHVFLCEEGGASQFAGVSPYPVRNEPTGELSLEKIQKVNGEVYFIAEVMYDRFLRIHYVEHACPLKALGE